MQIDKKRYIVFMLIICFVMTIANGIFYYKVEQLNKKEKEIVYREELIIQDKKTIKEEQDKIKKQIEDLNKVQKEIEAQIVDINKKEEALKDKEKALEEKEETLNKKEEELKIKEKEIKDKIVASEQKSSSNNNGSDKIAYLTFDDGPSDNTERILDTLAANNIKATFFVNGRVGRDSTYQRMYNEGHKIGNHTYSHDYSEVYSSQEAFFNSMNELNNFLAALGIPQPDIIRFPGGSNNKVSIQYGGAYLMDNLVASVSAYRYDYFDWNVSSGDANKITEDKNIIVNNVINGCSGKQYPVILMHDSAPKTTTADALQEIIDHLIGQGYSFGMLESGVQVGAKFK